MYNSITKTFNRFYCDTKTFINPDNNGAIRLLSDFSEINKWFK